MTSVLTVSVRFLPPTTVPTIFAELYALLVSPDSFQVIFAASFTEPFIFRDYFYQEFSIVVGSERYSAVRRLEIILRYIVSHVTPSISGILPVNTAIWVFP